MNKTKDENNIAFRRFGALLAIMFLLVFLSGCIGPNASNPNQASIITKFNDWFGNWRMPIILAMGIGVAIYSVAYFYAAAVEDDKIKSWVKNELIQVGFSALILGSAILMVYAITEVSASLPAYTPGQNQMALSWTQYVQASCARQMPPGMDRPCHIRIAEDYLEILAKASEAQALSIVRYEAFLYQLSSVGLGFKSLAAPGGALSISPFAGILPVIETLSFLFDLIMKNMLAVRAQQFILDFIHLAFFPFFLAVGIFFRTFYFTRRLGGLMIALAIGFYIVYPFMLIFWNGVLYSFTGPWNYAVTANGDPVDAIGMNLMRIDVSFDGVSHGVVAPVAAAPTYSQTCADGIIQQGEECNENDNAYDERTGAPHVGAFTCPPRDEFGNVLSGRAGDIYCDTNACKCTNSFYGGLSGDFRNDFLSGKMQGAELESQARIITQMCFTPPEGSQQQAEQKTRDMITAVTETWYNRLLEGYGGGISRALASDDLLGENGTIDNAAKLLIFSLVAPFIALMVALASIKVLSPMLGGDVEIAGLTRMI